MVYGTAVVGLVISRGDDINAVMYHFFAVLLLLLLLLLIGVYTRIEVGGEVEIAKQEFEAPRPQAAITARLLSVDVVVALQEENCACAAIHKTAST